MALHKIEKGLDLPIMGVPIQVVRERVRPQRVGLMADDFPGMKPAMRIKEGETVKRGQVLFEDRKNPGVLHTASAAGRVIGVHRGARRTLQSIVIDLSPAEREAARPNDVPDSELVAFESFTGRDPRSLDRDQVKALLVESGQWTALRTRPYSKVPAVDSEPYALFVTAMDTNPLAPLPEVALDGRQADFDRGLHALCKLTPGTTYLCVDPHSGIEKGVTAPVKVEHFSGPHPSGTVGLHIHKLAPVGRTRTVWHIHYADVAAIGALFATGKLDVERTVSIAGPARAGSAPGADATRRGRAGGGGRGLPGAVGRRGGPAHRRVGAVGQEGHGRRVRLPRPPRPPGERAAGRARARPAGLARAGLRRLLDLSRLRLEALLEEAVRLLDEHPRLAAGHGPIGMYEEVMPMDILPTFLLRSLIVGDVEQAERLGVLELDEEDLALCTFVCPGKTDYGPILRRNLEILEKEG